MFSEGSDEFARPKFTGTGTGPREVAIYMGPRSDPNRPPVIPPHVELLDRQALATKG